MKNAKISKYQKIYNYYVDKIEKGSLSEGDPLPAEQAICDFFSVSHMTYNKAMNELSNKGYINRIPGTGTFVSNAYKHHFTKQIIERGSITNLIKSYDKVPSSKLIKYQIITADNRKDISEVLNLSSEDYIHFFIRERYAGQELFCVSYTFVSQKILNAIDISALNGSFNEYIKKNGIYRSYGNEEICATLPDKELSKFFGTNHIALLKQKILWYVNDIPFELTYHYFPGEKFFITSQLLASDIK